MTQQWNHITKSHYTHFAYLLTYSFIFIVKETVADKSSLKFTTGKSWVMKTISDPSH